MFRSTARVGTAAAAALLLAVSTLVAPPAAATPRPVPDGPFAVGVRTETFVDTGRPTAANGTAPGLPSRTLVTTVFYPAQGDAAQPGEVVDARPARGRFPLLVFAHGFTANGPTYAFLLRQIAAEGYVVAAPTFPLSNGAATGGPNLGDYANQPADVSFVIDEMLRLNRTPGTWLRDHVQRRRIGVGGHSLGGITTLGFLNTATRDRRVDAIVPIAGVRLPFAGGTFGLERELPSLLIHADNDPVVPYSGSTTAYADASPPKFLLTLFGAGHSPFGGRAGEVLVESTVDFLDRYVALYRPAGGDLRRDGTVEGVSRLDVDRG